MKFKTQSLNTLLEINPNLNIQEIEELVINKYDVNNNPEEVYYQELLNFNNLHNLTLNGCILTNELMTILESLKIKELILINCETFEPIESSLFNLSLDTLIIDSTELDYQNIDEIYLPNLTLINILLPNIKINTNYLDISKITNLNNLTNIKTDTLKINIDQYNKYQNLLPHTNLKIMEMNGEFEIER